MTRSFNPLWLFPSEKLAEAAPRPPLENPSPHDDALTHMSTQAALIAGGVGAANAVLGMRVLRDDVPWPSSMPRYRGLPSLGALRDAIPNSRSKLLGLLPVSARPQQVSREELKEVTGKLKEMRPIVDSFIERHGLAEKGVTLNLRSGPLSTWMLGHHYYPITKEVNLPGLSKEVTLHELGHAADYTGSTIGKIRAIAEPALRNAIIPAVGAAVIAGDEIAKAIPGTVDDHAIRFLQDHAVAITGATLAATSIFPEAKASLLALKHIREVEGSPAALRSAKPLAAALGTYLLSAIPVLVGVSLARKCMRHQGTQPDSPRPGVGVAKTAGLGGFLEGFARGMGDEFGGAVKDFGHVAKEIGKGTIDLLRDPARGKRIGQAARHVGTSPVFVQGALTSAVPATVGALYLYGTKAGAAMRNNADAAGMNFKTRPRDDGWRERHPLAFAGMVGLGAALSAGVITQLMHDLQPVL